MASTDSTCCGWRSLDFLAGIGRHSGLLALNLSGADVGASLSVCVNDGLQRALNFLFAHPQRGIMHIGAGLQRMFGWTATQLPEWPLPRRPSRGSVVAFTVLFRVFSDMQSKRICLRWTASVQTRDPELRGS